MPPMPGVGSAPQPSGGSGVGALPPGVGALPPAGVFGGAMPALGGGATARGKSSVDLAFDNIMAVMPQLDSLMMSMRNVPQERILALPLTEAERDALQNDSLHERFLKLQRGAQKMMEGGGSAPDPNLSAEAEKFSADLTAHAEAMKSIHAKLGMGELPGPPPGPRDVAKLSPRGDL